MGGTNPTNFGYYLDGVACAPTPEHEALVPVAMHQLATIKMAAGRTITTKRKLKIMGMDAVSSLQMQSFNGVDRITISIETAPTPLKGEVTPLRECGPYMWVGLKYIEGGERIHVCDGEFEDRMEFSLWVWEPDSMPGCEIVSNRGNEDILWTAGFNRGDPQLIDQPKSDAYPLGALKYIKTRFKNSKIYDTWNDPFYEYHYLEYADENDTHHHLYAVSREAAFDPLDPDEPTEDEKWKWDNVVVLDPLEGFYVFPSETREPLWELPPGWPEHRPAGVRAIAWPDDYTIKVAAHCSYCNEGYRPAKVLLEVRVQKEECLEILQQEIEFAGDACSNSQRLTFPWGSYDSVGWWDDAWREQYENGPNPHWKNWWQGAVLANPYGGIKVETVNKALYIPRGFDLSSEFDDEFPCPYHNCRVYHITAYGTSESEVTTSPECLAFILLRPPINCYFPLSQMTLMVRGWNGTLYNQAINAQHDMATGFNGRCPEDADKFYGQASWNGDVQFRLFPGGDVFEPAIGFNALSGDTINCSAGPLTLDIGMRYTLICTDTSCAQASAASMFDYTCEQCSSEKHEWCHLLMGGGLRYSIKHCPDGSLTDVTLEYAAGYDYGFYW